MPVAEILHHKGRHVSTIRSVDSVEAAVRKLYDERIGALVVVDRWGKLAGMFSDRIDDVMKVMTAHRVRHLPVMEGQELVGLVSIGDLVKHRLDEKEQEAAVLRDITRARR